MAGRFVQRVAGFAVALAALAATACADLAADLEPLSGRRGPQGREDRRAAHPPRAGHEGGPGRFEHNAADLLIPASNQKLVTTACAIEILGIDFKFRTALLTRADGTLALVGDGDPALGDPQFAQFIKGVTPRTTATFTAWADALRKTGRERFSEVLVDDSVFDEVLFSPNWPIDQANLSYVPEVSGLSFNANCLDVYLIVGANGVEIRTDPSTAFLPITDLVSIGERRGVAPLRKPGTNQITARGTINGSNTRVPLRMTIHEPALVAGHACRTAWSRVRESAQRRGAARSHSPASVAQWPGGVGLESVLAVNQTPLMDVIRLYQQGIQEPLRGVPAAAAWRRVAREGQDRRATAARRCASSSCTPAQRPTVSSPMTARA